MAVLGLPGFGIVGAASVLLLFLAAKAHGRQVRLERELEGYMDVDFTADNPGFVEDLWRRDRRTYLVALAGSGVLFAGYFAAAGLGNLWLPAFGDPPVGLTLWHFAILLLWVPVAAFTMSGLSSARRLLRALGSGGPEGRRGDRVRRDRGGWLASALRGTAFWWSVVLGVEAAIAVLSV